jgi:hypothetical protein
VSDQDPVVDRMAQLVAGMEALMAQVGQTSEKIDRFIADVHTDDAALRKDVHDEMGKTRSDFLAELGKRSHDIMDKIESLHVDIGVNMGSVDMARKANDNTRDDVTQMRETLATMYRRMLGIEADIRELKGDP